MKALSKKVIDFMLRNRIISEQDKEIYLFGLVLMLRTLLNVLTSVVIGFWFKMPVESIVFVICSVGIRTYSGGFHADNPIICYAISVVAIVLMLLSIKSGLWNVPISFVLMALSIGIIMRYAPVEHKNKPLEEIERKIYKRKLLVVVTVLVLTSVLLTLAHCYFLLFSLGFSFLVSAIMILHGKRFLE